MTAIAYPFLRPGPDRISAGPWLVTRDGEPCVFADGHLDLINSPNYQLNHHERTRVELIALRKQPAQHQ